MRRSFHKGRNALPALLRVESAYVTAVRRRLVGGATTEVSDGGMVEDVGGRIADIQQKTEEPTMLAVGPNTMAERVCILEGSQRSINPANHFTQSNPPRRSL